MKRLTLLCLALACAACRSSVAAADEPLDFAELIELARRYDLPLPPRTAPAVLAITPYRTCQTKDVGRVCRVWGVYKPAFLLDERSEKGPLRVLMGWTVVAIHRLDSDNCPAMRPYSLAPQDPDLSDYLFAREDGSMFVTAVQLAQRGDLPEAQELWTRLQATLYFGEDTLKGNPTRAQLRLLLARCIYQCQYEAFLEPDADLPAIYEKLARLKEEFPAIFAEENQREGENPAEFLRDLAFTIAAPPPEEGSVAAQLIAHGNQRDDEGRWLWQEIRVILDRGVRVIPDLARLVPDRRLTRLTWPVSSYYPWERRARLGELAAQLLRKMAGSQRAADFAALDLTGDGEREFLERASVELKAGRTSAYHDWPLKILGEKYPRSLLDLCAKIPAESTEDLSIRPLVEAVGRSTLTRDEKTESLAALCARLGESRRRQPVLLELAGVDEERCTALLRPIISQLPRDVDESYRYCQESEYSEVVAQLQDEQIWIDYLQVVRRAAVGLKMEMLDGLTHPHDRDPNRRLHLAFLAAFLDDATRRNKIFHPWKYDGFCAAEEFQRIEVRNFAAMACASILEFEEEPTELWSNDEWDDFRQRVRTALDQENLPVLAD